MSGHEDADESRRRYQAPYSQRRPIPTISKYREEKEARRAEAGRETNGADLGPSRTDRAKEEWQSYRDWWNGDKDENHEEQGIEDEQWAHTDVYNRKFRGNDQRWAPTEDFQDYEGEYSPLGTHDYK